MNVESDLAPLLGSLTDSSTTIAANLGVAPLLHVEGSQADLDAPQPTEDRAIWVLQPGGWTFGPLAVQPSDGHAVAEHREAFFVLLYASTRAALKLRVDLLVATLADVLTIRFKGRRGPGSVEIDGATARAVGSGTEQSGWSCPVPVTLLGPVYNLVYGVGLISSTSGNVFATLPDGASPTELPTDGAP